LQLELELGGRQVAPRTLDQHHEVTDAFDHLAVKVERD
jgi:hypothetical protein